MEGVKGKLLNALTSASKVEDTVIFFPYFKVLFRLVQIALTMKRRQNLEMRQVQADKNIEDL